MNKGHVITSTLLQLGCGLFDANQWHGASDGGFTQPEWAGVSGRGRGSK